MPLPNIPTRRQPPFLRQSPIYYEDSSTSDESLEWRSNFVERKKRLLPQIPNRNNEPGTSGESSRCAPMPGNLAQHPKRLLPQIPINYTEPGASGESSEWVHVPGNLVQRQKRLLPQIPINDEESSFYGGSSEMMPLPSIIKKRQPPLLRQSPVYYEDSSSSDATIYIYSSSGRSLRMPLLNTPEEGQPRLLQESPIYCEIASSTSDSSEMMPLPSILVQRNQLSGAMFGSRALANPLPPDMIWNPMCPLHHQDDDERLRQYIQRYNQRMEMFVTDYLNTNRDFLMNYVRENVAPVDVEEYLSKDIMQTQSVEPVGPNLLKKDFKSQKKIFMERLESLNKDPCDENMIYELGNCIANAIGVDAFRMFKVVAGDDELVHYIICEKIGVGVKRYFVQIEADLAELVMEVAKTGETMRVSRLKNPERFPTTPISIFETIDMKHKEANQLLYQPLLGSSGDIYVVEMWRVNASFSPEDETISSNFFVLGSLSLFYCNLYKHTNSQRSLSDFMLDVVKAIFEEMVSLDQLIKKILEFAQRLVNADRASLFLVDNRSEELVSTVFDLKFESGQSTDKEKEEIRIPISRGIAGHVALSGETMNIPDAYSDYRFNRAVDEATGYKTVNILCMPIKVQGEVIGVVQMVNKRNSQSFLREDEIAFEIFSSFFGLALHHARLYDRIKRKEQKYKVALEVLTYHNTCKEHEVEAIFEDKNRVEVDLNDFYLDPYKCNEFEKCKAVITMFNDLFDLSKFSVKTVIRFILTVKKNYRTVPYHNFDHGWSVANSIYVMLKNDIHQRFNYKMRLALFVACLCHDLDHRGYTNKYMSETASPLAAMYTTSPLEHHHFNITVTILQQGGHNIFSHISGDEYKEILDFIRQCILATDLAAFFPNLAKLQELYKDTSESTFSWTNSSHRDLAMAISMTAADLSASAKPWKIQIKTVKVIFEEFYDQGDKERAAGRSPIPMMDRNKPNERPASQVGFLSQICIPCYKMLYQILPNSKPMYAMAMKNFHNWKLRADRFKLELNRGEVEEIEESDAEDVPEEILFKEQQDKEYFETSDDDDVVGRVD